MQTVRVDQFVRVSWATPSSNYATITAYEVFIKSQAATFTVESVYCLGSTTAVLTNRYCDIPVTALRASPFNLAL